MSEVNFSEVFEALPVACAVLSTDLVFVAANHAYQELVGQSRDRLIGREMFDVFSGGPSGGPRELRASLQRVVSEGETDVLALQRYDLEEADRPGVFQERYWTAVNSPVKDRDGRVVLVLNRVSEVTEFVQRIREADARSRSGGPAPAQAATVADGVEAAEAELFVRGQELQQVNRRLQDARARERRAADAARQALRRQQQVVADTSHDLRGPLAGLQTRLELALSDPDADSREVLHAALHDAERLGDIVADLLELARLEAGSPMPTQAVDLGGLVRDELAARSPAVEETGDLAPGVMVEGSVRRLRRLLNNLLSNAERHARARVGVSVASTGDQAVLEIADDGPGIPATEREAVFDRFYRRPDARRSDPEGTGLGLSIARQIAHAHHGTLDIADQAEGTRMVLRLPLRPPSE